MQPDLFTVLYRKKSYYSNEPILRMLLNETGCSQKL